MSKIFLKIVLYITGLSMRIFSVRLFEWVDVIKLKIITKPYHHRPWVTWPIDDVQNFVLTCGKILLQSQIEFLDFFQANTCSKSEMYIICAQEFTAIQCIFLPFHRLVIHSKIMFDNFTISVLHHSPEIVQSIRHG